jgi:hypothetical protein
MEKLVAAKKKEDGYLAILEKGKVVRIRARDIKL